ncbi:glycosyltransferase [Frigoribacterium sp. PvP032]|uniref:glycosyltransferase n=1 Tax=Frigoribacterium sp. PvP032 TaxID=2806589 RepID=UPI001AE31664|nr:glycosyltransferase [Frigoribacterium sp. PvP032]MBP1189394.1 glycosyltransferase involved in cell wall biosynthesis [Frigoribacterium sp. PvP032]
MSRPLRVLQYRVHDTSYPRNRRLREHLRAEGCEVTVLTASRGGPRALRLLRDVVRLARGCLRHDVVVLSELRLAHAPYVGVVGRLTRSTVVVDGFVGLHETEVGDWGRVRPGSLRASALRLQDELALRAAHVWLVDTDVRARRAAASRAAVRTRVVALPVGAPDWAVAVPPRGPGETLHLLWYGNYIPLHGLDLVVEALALTVGRRDVHLTLVGDGGTRAATEHAVRERGLDGLCTFLGPVPESELAGLIASADVALGIFGSSEKARSVIANKVWQGLSCGRVVVTAETPALAEIAEAAGPLLVTTAPGSAASLADALCSVDPVAASRAVPDVDRRLAEVVRLGWSRLAVRSPR